MGNHTGPRDERARWHWDEQDRAEVKGSVGWLLRFILLVLLIGIAIEVALAWWAGAAL